MRTFGNDIEEIRLRDCSTAFSRSVFTDVLLYDDFSHLDWLYSRYGFRCKTYFDLIKRVYSSIAEKYRCEYVFKNELIGLLLNRYGVNDTVYFSEFRVGCSIADMVMFNGESKVFEIKTQYDSPRRLDKQMEDYKRFFDKCYLVITESELGDYLSTVDDDIGLIVMCGTEYGLVLHEIREAKQNMKYDPTALISCLRAKEYESIVEHLGFDAKSVPGYERYEFCSDVFAMSSKADLKRLFLEEVKNRKNCTRLLRKYPMALRQMLLSLNLSERKSALLIDKLKTIINKS